MSGWIAKSKLKPFVKGERVYMHSSDSRNPDYDMEVVSVGKKWITCKYIGAGERRERFDAENYYMESWSCYRLYHNKEEWEEEVKREDLARKFREMAITSAFSYEELVLFQEIHNTGIDLWKQQNLKQHETGNCAE